MVTLADLNRDTKVNISPNTLKRIFGKISVDDIIKKASAIADTLT